MSPILIWPGVLVCALIILACICRVNLMRAGTHKFGWALLTSRSLPLPAEC
jgi:hypothetical protein